jgi:hypothetical protein
MEQIYKQQVDSSWVGMGNGGNHYFRSVVEEGSYGYVDESNWKQGLWIDWFQRGSKNWERSYYDNQRHGPSTSWYANGKPHVAENFISMICKKDFVPLIIPMVIFSCKDSCVKTNRRENGYRGMRMENSLLNPSSSQENRKVTSPIGIVTVTKSPKFNIVTVSFMDPI